MSLLKKISEIYDGWKNLLNKKVTIEEIAAVRKTICRSNLCGFYMLDPYRGCSACGCPEKAKIRSLKSACPDGRFGYAHELKLQLTEQLLDDLSGFKKVNKGKSIQYFKGDFVMNFDLESKMCTFRDYKDQEPIGYWNELWSFYKKVTDKKLY